MKAQLCGDHDSRTWPCGMAGAGLTPLILVKEGEIVYHLDFSSALKAFEPEAGIFMSAGKMGLGDPALGFSALSLMSPASW